MMNTYRKKTGVGAKGNPAAGQGGADGNMAGTGGVKGPQPTRQSPPIVNMKAPAAAGQSAGQGGAQPSPQDLQKVFDMARTQGPQAVQAYVAQQHGPAAAQALAQHPAVQQAQQAVAPAAAQMSQLGAGRMPAPQGPPSSTVMDQLGAGRMQMGPGGAGAPQGYGMNPLANPNPGAPGGPMSGSAGGPSPTMSAMNGMSTMNGVAAASPPGMGGSAAPSTAGLAPRYQAMIAAGQDPAAVAARAAQFGAGQLPGQTPGSIPPIPGQPAQGGGFGSSAHPDPYAPPTSPGGPMVNAGNQIPGIQGPGAGVQPPDMRAQLAQRLRAGAGAGNNPGFNQGGGNYLA